MIIANRHQEQPIFVCGFSPFIHQLDHSHLNGQIVIAINDFGNWWPESTYWIAYDSHKMSYEKGYKDKVIAMPHNKFMRWDRCTSPAHEHDERLGNVTWYKTIPAVDDTLMIRQWDGKLCHLGTTATNAIHLAYIMGASQIILWGVDLTGDTRADGTEYNGQDYWGRFRGRFNQFLTRFDVPIYRTNPNAKINAEFRDYREIESHAPRRDDAPYRASKARIKRR